MHHYTIETERLLLRPLTVADAEAEYTWTSDPEVNRYMAYPLNTDIEQTRAWLRTVEGFGEDHLEFGFERKSDGVLIGAGGAYLKEGGAWEIGYNFRRDCWGQGYATEAMRAVIDFVHREKGVKVFISEHAVGNPASGRVMEKCGLRYDHDGECAKTDGSEIFQAKFYRLELK